jgi:hypothetical protein
MPLCEACYLSSRKKIRPRHREEAPLLDDLFGRRAALRLRVASALVIGVLFFGGCALFLFESQTFGRVGIALGTGWALFWLLVRRRRKHGANPFEALRHQRRSLIGLGVLVVAAGWAVFFTVWENLGLLLVVLGAIPLLIVTLGVRQREQLLSPMDGPPFGDTGPT